MDLCVLCLDGLEPSMVSPDMTNLHLEHVGVTYPPAASSAISWRRFVRDKRGEPWWKNWLDTAVIDLPCNSTDTTENTLSESQGGLLFDGFPNDTSAAKLLLYLSEELVQHEARLLLQCLKVRDADVLIAYLGISDTIGHVHRTWKPEMMQFFYQTLDAMAEQLWKHCRPKRRAVLSDHGMAPITSNHKGWNSYHLLDGDAYVKQLDDGRYVVQTGQHWKIVPGYFSSDFLPGSHSLRKIGRTMRETIT